MFTALISKLLFPDIAQVYLCTQIILLPPVRTQFASQSRHRMAANPQPPRRGLADFQLEREAGGPLPILPAWYFDYLDPYIGATTAADWNMFVVHREDIYGDGDDTHVRLLNYATSLPRQTYQVLNAKLVNPDGQRITDMRLHEMIRSTWDAETETQLTRLGVRQIENASARTAILDEYERAASDAIKNEFESAISQGANPMGLTLTISGAGALSPYWKDNPFLRTAVHVAGDRNRVTAHLIKEDTSVMPRMNMVMELDGPRGQQAAP